VSREGHSYRAFTGFVFPGFPEEILETPSPPAKYVLGNPFLLTDDQKCFFYTTITSEATSCNQAVRQIRISHFRQEREKKLS
jgi:hypothetical protein